MKTGLVMEGGAMRGMFTCGIIDVWMENGITFDGAVGVSAGAAFGCNIKSKQLGRALRYNKKYCGDKRYASIKSWLKTGDLFNADFCYRELVTELDPWDEKTFQENPMDFYAVVSDIRSGKPVYKKLEKGDAKDIQWIRASSSIPIASAPVKIDGGVYLDGGITDSIPLKFMEKEGYDKIIVIETQPFDYVKKPQRYMTIAKLFLRKYPNMIKAMKDRYLMYNEEKQYVKSRESTGDIFVIRPDQPLNIGAVTKDPMELDRVYQLGRKKGLETLDEVHAYLG